jgi:signal transduction histidine kinase
MNPDLAADIQSIQSIGAVPTILEAIATMTGLGFVCIARVTENSWTTCAVLDKLNFGLKVGDPLDVTTTLCEAVRDTRTAIIIDEVRSDPVYRDHHTPRLYGFQSYFSIPLFRPDGAYFGTLCGLDPKEARLSEKTTVDSMTLFAQLISLQLENERSLEETRSALMDEREAAVLREKFIAVLGHDLRNPLGSILMGTDLLMTQTLAPKSQTVVERIRRSAQRIATLVDDVVDFTRGQMGGGIALRLEHETRLAAAFEQVIAELRSTYPERSIEADLSACPVLLCDAQRMAQMLSNLLKNALVHGDVSQPVKVGSNFRDHIFSLSVSNGGEPIAASKISQLFKPFWRETGERAQDGLGLGLFIVAEIAQAHGGTIDVRSDAEATVFTYSVKAAS